VRRHTELRAHRNAPVGGADLVDRDQQFARRSIYILLLGHGNTHFTVVTRCHLDGSRATRSAPIGRDLRTDPDDAGQPERTLKAMKCTYGVSASGLHRLSGTVRSPTPEEVNHRDTHRSG
jgi:hypothetical protein